MSHQPDSLWQGAVQVLLANDLGGWTRPAPRLYPHQWSWDSAFIAIGIAHLDPDRALRELEHLFAGQWTDGRVPQIVYNPAAPREGYFPDAARWACAELHPGAPRQPQTSGIVQPPVHALALERICKAIPDPANPLASRVRALYPKVVAWHAYLATARDPGGSGLLTIYHPWESGTDNSPRWDAPLENVEVGHVPPYVRRDLQHVADPSHRPTNAEYDRYLWLVESLKQARYDDAVAHRDHPFLIKDVLMSAIFAAANATLAEVAAWLGQAEPEYARLRAWEQRTRQAVEARVDAQARLALDLDLRSGEPVRVRTWAGLAPLLVPGLAPEIAAAMQATLTGPDFAGARGQPYVVVPSTAPGSPGYRVRTYWRGPAWPVANWLLWWGLRRQGLDETAANLRRANLALLAQPEARFAEYFETTTGAPLGSFEQSWTAAAALDWLAAV